jgi:hypothetical protein
MRLSRGRVQPTLTSTVESRGNSIYGSHSEPPSASGSSQKTLLSARRPESDPLVLHLIEMHPRIVLGDGESEGRDVQPANR